VRRWSFQKRCTVIEVAQRHNPALYGSTPCEAGDEKIEDIETRIVGPIPPERAIASGRRMRPTPMATNPVTRKITAAMRHTVQLIKPMLYILRPDSGLLSSLGQPVSCVLHQGLAGASLIARLRFGVG